MCIVLTIAICTFSGYISVLSNLFCAIFARVDATTVLASLDLALACTDAMSPPGAVGAEWGEWAEHCAAKSCMSA